MDQITTSRNAPATPRRSLRRTVLGVTAAALVAAWLPFTVIFVNAIQHPVAPIVSVKAGSVKPGQRVVTTRTSGGQLVQSVVPGGQAQSFVAQSAPITSRSS